MWGPERLQVRAASGVGPMGCQARPLHWSRSEVAVHQANAGVHGSARAVTFGAMYGQTFSVFFCQVSSALPARQAEEECCLRQQSFLKMSTLNEEQASRHKSSLFFKDCWAAQARLVPVCPA